MAGTTTGMAAASGAVVLAGLCVLGTAWASNWKPVAEGDGCRFFVGDAVDGFSPVRAECDWDLPPEKVQRVLADLARHDDYFTSVKQAERLPSGRYRQIHQASGISDREIILDMGSEAIPGGTRYWWRKAADQSELTGNNVETTTNTGKWEVTAAAGGGTGSHVVYELYYNPGGSVPSFLVRWFQTSGTQQLVGELKRYTESH